MKDEEQDPSIVLIESKNQLRCIELKYWSYLVPSKVLTLLSLQILYIRHRGVEIQNDATLIHTNIPITQPVYFLIRLPNHCVCNNNSTNPKQREYL